MNTKAQRTCGHMVQASLVDPLFCDVRILTGGDSHHLSIE